MRFPLYKYLKETSGISYQGTNMHSNPKIYKYKWRIFTSKSKAEGPLFFLTEKEISTAKAFELINLLVTANKSAIVYNRKIPRENSLNIFSHKSDKWKNIEWACSYEEDIDSPWNGHK